MKNHSQQVSQLIYNKLVMKGKGLLFEMVQLYGLKYHSKTNPLLPQLLKDILENTRFGFLCFVLPDRIPRGSKMSFQLVCALETACLPMRYQLF